MKIRPKIIKKKSNARMKKKYLETVMETTVVSRMFILTVFIIIG